MKYTLVVDDGIKERKITKIFTYNDGGFAVAMPYHTAKRGYLFKTEIDYSQKWQAHKPYSEYVVSDKVKLSMHMDGFVQFSGENPNRILSGRDEFGDPKGLGYMTSPLTDPIMTGPTFTINFWGLDDYAEFKSIRTGEEKVLFGESDIYYRDFPDECNSYLIEGFVFPKDLIAGVRKEKNGLIMDRCFMNFQSSGAVIQLKILLTESKEYFLGLFISKAHTTHSSESGFVLGAPSKLRKASSNLSEIMRAIYPRPDRIDEEETSSLDYIKP